MSTRRLVDWELAAATARRVVPPGPSVPFAEASRVVADLRRLADEADAHVREFTGLDAPRGDGLVAVVDRPGWVQANVDGFRAVLEPVTEQLLAKRRSGPADGVVEAVGSRITGVQLGLLLAYLASRVLGQYELFLPPADQAGPDGESASSNGRLTLVAPNVLAAERMLGVDPHDFRLWVCLHEVTHRTQFTAVPWLRDHVQSEMTAFLLAGDLDPAALAARLREALGAIVDSIRGRGELSVLELVQSPEQRVILDRMTGLMSLVEGHGEYVMDGVGPAVVPSVAQIRERFERRRHAVGPIEKVIRRLLGIDMKMRQYADGEKFVRAVVDRVGMEGFNRVWTSPNTLPTRAEIAEPLAWVRRVHGAAAASES